MKLRHALFVADPKYKKQKKYSEDESDLDEDEVAEHEELCKAREIEKAEKKFAKENEKLAEEGKPVQDEDVLRTRLDAIEDEFAKLEKERGTGKAALKRDRPPEKLIEAIEKLEDRIKTFKLQMVDREAGKEVALGTSRINYLDPRYGGHDRLAHTSHSHTSPFFIRSDLTALFIVGDLTLESLRRGARSTMYP
jgi:DNA topoisomerase-1